MATALGAGTSLATSWFLDLPTTQERFAPPPPPAPVAVDPPETTDLLARLTRLLAAATAGLTLPELRARLVEQGALGVDALQRALAVGLRSKQLRRLGSHNKLRYVLNA